MSEWSKEHAWKVCIPQKGIKGSNPFSSAVGKAGDAGTAFYCLAGVEDGVYSGGHYRASNKNLWLPDLPNERSRREAGDNGANAT